MKEVVTILKNVASKDGLDYDFLRNTGLEYIEKIGSDIWTDYNVHDPGVTILEMLAYAITDLSQRIDMPIENLLASDENNLSKMHEQFLSAINILPSKAVTALDYRSLFSHIKGVKNSWIKAHEQLVHINCDTHPAQFSYTPFTEAERNLTPFVLKGLNDIIIDLEEDVEDPDAILNVVRNVYHNNRSLCEDLVNVTVVEEHPIAVCAYIDLHPGADEEYIQALIYRAIDHYFSPSVNFYSLQQMFDKGYTTDQIFEGPIPISGDCTSFEDPKGGFIDRKELSEADLRKEIRLSDIIQLIMNIEGVNIVKDISIGNCDGKLGLEGHWNICVKEWHKPVRCDKSIFKFSKGLLPIGVNVAKVQAFMDQLKAEEKAKQLAVTTQDVAMPQGEYSDAGNNTTMQNDFPDTYGISEIGLPGNASVSRKAKANQLKGYLLFFDQILANYFQHLAKVKDLLSVDESLKKLYLDNVVLTASEELKAKQTFYSQGVEDIKDFDNIVGNPLAYEDNLINIMNEVKGDNTGDTIFYERRNILLDHLLGRFSERFSDYVFIMKTVYGDSTSTNDDILRTKLDFLYNYKQIGCERGMGFNYCHPLQTEGDDGIWDTKNVSGVEKRISKLLGIQDFSRRDLVSGFLEVYEEKDDDDLVEYRWRIKGENKILLSSSKHYHTLTAAYEELYLAYHLARNPENYDLKKTKKGTKTYFNLTNPDITDENDEDRIVARRIAYTSTKEKSEAARDELIKLIRELSADEGMYMIEHILLRPDTMNLEQFDNDGDFLPDASPEDFMPSCLDENCETCSPIDPYSFRVTIILPGWTYRFGNISFRRFAEQLIREELPAHVLAKICWIGQPKGLVPDEENDMLQIQKKYKEFLKKLHCDTKIDSKAKLKKYRKTVNALVLCMNKMHTIYHSGRLHDCDNDETEEIGNKIILGQTNIGQL
ncbi:hypothetical protein [Ulvibacter antarcticus]|uniref:Uncharacterized protein n=1 Tax=Ulvibacter antarcticus TaxID=442714 RepID=A0A3L9YL45_9FLAO|nr:hypothetical protein [Ulvibacter antarcticus]RMA58865.1 hypothetical protein BXY75_2245 [Ulvibacter antarcticus]